MRSQRQGWPPRVVHEISPETRQRPAATLSGLALRSLPLARGVPALARIRTDRSGMVRGRRQQDFRMRLDSGQLFEEADPHTGPPSRASTEFGFARTEFGLGMRLPQYKPLIATRQGSSRCHASHGPISTNSGRPCSPMNRSQSYPHRSRAGSALPTCRFRATSPAHHL